VHRLDITKARRLAIQAQMLSSERPVDLLSTVERLTFLQIDPTAAVAPSADLVAWSRLGDRYHPDDLKRAVEEDRTIYEQKALLRPMSDLRLYRADMESWPHHEQIKGWLAVNDSFRRDILALLATSGPLLSRDIPDTSIQPWQSTGWTNARNVTQMLEFLARRGEVAIAGRRGRQRLWDVPERVYPAGIVAVPSEEAHRFRDERRLRALGIARSNLPQQPIEPYHVGEVGEAATVNGVEGEWRVDPALLDAPFQGRTALLSPFDRLIHDRARTEDLFGFEYVLEMYKPEAQRRWGYFALPILHQDRLVGKLDAKADRKAGVFVVRAIHDDVSFDAATREGVRTEIEHLARWLDLELVGV
jgi:uncharacterized protein